MSARGRRDVPRLSLTSALVRLHTGQSLACRPRRRRRGSSYSSPPAAASSCRCRPYAGVLRSPSAPLSGMST
eukprot:807606-Pleurochrysis_carterae.AAC.1